MTEAESSPTPLIQQFLDIKARHPDTILFFRVGDFYEMFFDDAKDCSRLLGINLTSRNNGNNDVPLAGVPVKAVDEYLPELLRQGRRVAICEQVEDSSQAEGLVDREVIEVITPGTVLEDTLLSAKKNNFVAAVAGDDPVGIATLDVSTGEFETWESAADSLRDELGRLEPAEVLVPDEREEIPDGPWSVTGREAWRFEEAFAEETLCREFDVQSTEGFGFEPDRDAHMLRAAGGLVAYLDEVRPAGLEHLQVPEVHRRGRYMHLDEMTRRNLELVEPLRNEGGGTLLEVIDRTETSMGGRLLRRRILHPLVDAEEIRARHDAVAELEADGPLRTEVRDELSRVRDLERLAGKISSGRAAPRDLLSLADSLEVLPDVLEALGEPESGRLGTLAEELDPLVDVRETVREAIDPEAPPNLKDGGVIREGYSEELDEIRETRDGAVEFIAEMQSRERERTGIDSLKIGHNKVFGYYIEVTRANLDRVPDDYHRKQTLKNAERYFTPELKEWEEKVVGAEERIEELEVRLYRELREELGAEVERVQETARRVAALDVLAGLADVADRHGYARPDVTEDFGLEIREGRHPVVERMIAREEFIPNDVVLDEDMHLMVLTGPNMSGKSTVLRQVGLIALLAQMGSFVPASSARVGICDRVFTRVGASDNLVRGQSTFMVEMTETATILNSASDRSLVLLDEIGRGTSTYDGVSIAWAVTEYIHEHVGARTIFATHYHELVELADRLDGVGAYNVSVRETDDGIVFLRRLEEGGCDRSYGVHVGELAGLPEGVIDRARQVLDQLENGPDRAGSRLARFMDDEQDQIPLFRVAEGPPAGREGSPDGAGGGEKDSESDVGEPEAVRRLRELDTHRMTPLEALNRLDELARLARGDDAGEEGEAA